MGEKKYRQFSREFKLAAVGRMQAGVRRTYRFGNPGLMPRARVGKLRFGMAAGVGVREVNDRTAQCV